ncbi:hypothetical protein Y032_0015g2821 [Ancylostoma ceylanicum]|nr:hypothetical protein Y032_0015g2821 [Ancylostoma ceylanicum]
MRAIPSRSISQSNKVEARRRTLCLITTSNIVLIAHSNPEIQILYFHLLIAQNWQRAKYVAATEDHLQLQHCSNEKEKQLQFISTLVVLWQATLVQNTGPEQLT